MKSDRFECCDFSANWVSCCAFSRHQRDRGRRGRGDRRHLPVPGGLRDQRDVQVRVVQELPAHRRVPPCGRHQQRQNVRPPLTREPLPSSILFSFLTSASSLLSPSLLLFPHSILLLLTFLFLLSNLLSPRSSLFFPPFSLLSPFLLSPASLLRPHSSPYSLFYFPLSFLSKMRGILILR